MAAAMRVFNRLQLLPHDKLEVDFPLGVHKVRVFRREDFIAAPEVGVPEDQVRPCTQRAFGENIDFIAEVGSAQTLVGRAADARHDIACGVGDEPPVPEQ